MTALTPHALSTVSDKMEDPPVWLARLSLSNFRNYSQAQLALDAKSVVLTGNNGSGKTNILEAVSMLTAGRGLRGSPFSDLPRVQGDGSWAVSARLWLRDYEISLGTGQQQAMTGMAGRSVKIDGALASSSGALGEYLQIIWLIPAMDGLFAGPASERRRFLDRMVATFDLAHRTRLNHFERAMRQRNRLLETGERSDRFFSAIEAQMAETGTAIAAARIEAVDRMAGTIQADQAAKDGAFPWAELALQGGLEAELREMAAVDAEDNYARLLSETRARDRAAGRTLDGPHRSDMLVRHGPKNMPANLCSTGEQKALLIGLILAHAKAVKDARGGLAPLLLLDEIAAHLDGLRREALFEEIERLRTQAWMTGTDPEMFAALAGKAQFFTVANSVISRNDDEGRNTARQLRTG